MPFNIGGYMYNGGIADSADYVNIITKGLVMHLDASATPSYPRSGTAWSDISSQTNNGTLTNGPTYSSTDGGSISFDGTNDYVACGTGINHGTSAFTYEAWINTNSITGGYGWIMGKSGYNMGLNRYDNILQFFLYNSSNNLYAESVYILTVGTWWHVVGAFDGSTIRLYVNGNQYGAGQNIGTSKDYGAGDLYLGTPNASNLMWNGKIASAKVYNRVLAIAEIKQNFNIQRSRFGI